MKDGVEIICLNCPKQKEHVEQFGTGIEKCIHSLYPSLTNQRVDLINADIFPEMICSICLNVMDYNGITAGIRGCIHYFHASCLDKWVETFEERGGKPTCPTCRKNGDFVDTILETNRRFWRIQTKPDVACKEDFGEKNCTVCKMDWNNEFSLTCSDCQSCVHTYCLDPPIKMEANISWRCKKCWLQKTLSFNGTQLSIMSFLNATSGICRSYPLLMATKKQIAIIGSGPCGLAAATHLSSFGHDVHVYEKNEKCGGLLREGILTMNISRIAIDKILKNMANSGIKFICNKYIDNEEYRGLLTKYNAVIICTGARMIRRDFPDNLNNKDGIYYIPRYFSIDENKRERLKHLTSGRRVIYITNNKLSEARDILFLKKVCKTVEIIELLPQPKNSRRNVDFEFPCPKLWPCFIKSTKDIVVIENNNKNEGVQAAEIVKSIKITKTPVGNEAFKGLELIHVAWDSSNSAFREFPDTQRIIRSDLLLVSSEIIRPSTKSSPDFGLNYDDSSNIITTDNSFKTGTDKVFAAGDCVHGETTLSQAFLNGFCVAQQVNQFCMQYHNDLIRLLQNHRI